MEGRDQSNWSSWTSYNTGKQAPNFAAAHQTSGEAENVAVQKIDPRTADIYCLARQMWRDTQYVMGEKSDENQAGQLSLDEATKNAV